VHLSCVALSNPTKDRSIRGGPAPGSDNDEASGERFGSAWVREPGQGQREKW
jgi:hypothetical protein